jgi:hypothetical protein
LLFIWLLLTFSYFPKLFYYLSVFDSANRFYPPVPLFGC